MEVEVINDGPVTLVFDSFDKELKRGNINGQIESNINLKKQENETNK